MRITAQNPISTQQPQLADALANLQVGDSVKGRLVELLGERISIRTSSGQVLTAALMTEANLKLGEMLELNIKSITAEGVFAELKSNDQKAAFSEDGKLQQLLKQLNIKPEDNSMQAAKLLMKYNMPLTKDNIVNLVQTQKSVEVLAQGDANKAAALMQSEFNINDTELLRLVKQALILETQGKQAASQPQIKDIEPEVAAMSRSEVPEETNAPKLEQSAGVEKSPKLAMEKLVEQTVAKADAQTAPKLEKLMDTIMKVFETAAQAKPEHTAYLKSKDMEITPAAMKALADHTTGANKLSKQIEGLEKLVTVLESNNVDVAELKQDVKKLFLKPEALLDKEQVIENVKDVVKVAGKIESLLRENHLEHKVESNVLQDTKNNLDFVKNINTNINYLQVPIQMNEQKATADLYVFSGKRKNKNVNPENATILIALDLNRLGHIESLISVNKKNVNVTFKIEKEEFKKVISSSSEALKIALEARGYMLNPLRIIDIGDKFNLLELEELDKVDSGQFHVDIKV